MQQKQINEVISRDLRNLIARGIHATVLSRLRAAKLEDSPSFRMWQARAEKIGACQSMDEVGRTVQSWRSALIVLDGLNATCGIQYPSHAGGSGNAPCEQSCHFPVAHPDLHPLIQCLGTLLGTRRYCGTTVLYSAIPCSIMGASTVPRWIGAHVRLTIDADLGTTSGQSDTASQRFDLPSTSSAATSEAALAADPVASNQRWPFFLPSLPPPMLHVLETTRSGAGIQRRE